MNCAECIHYHDLGDKLMCDAGLMEVMMVGNPQVVVKMQQCEKFEKNCNSRNEIGSELLKVVHEMHDTKIDKRTKEYKEKHK